MKITTRCPSDVIGIVIRDSQNYISDAIREAIEKGNPVFVKSTRTQTVWATKKNIGDVPPCVDTSTTEEIKP